MLTLKSLNFKAIGRFVDEQSINFEALNGLTQLCGQNNNTGGSSGSGKSTVFLALEYLFGLNKLPDSVLQSRLTKDGRYVRAEFDLDGKDLIIERSKSKFSIDLDGTVTTGSNAITESKLDEILGMPRNIFRPMFHKRQKEGGFFLNFTPKQIYEFLMDCLGLNELKNKNSIIDLEIQKLTASISNAKMLIEKGQSSLDSIIFAINALSKPEEYVHDIDYIQTLVSKIGKQRALIDSYNSEYKIEKSALEGQRPTTTVIAFDKSEMDRLSAAVISNNHLIQELKKVENDRLLTLSTQIYSIKAIKSSLEYKKKEADQAQKTAVSLMKEVQKLREAICPNCEQSWIHDSAKEQELQKIEQLKSLKLLIEEGKLAAIKIQQLESEIEELSLSNKPKEIKEVTTLQKFNEDLNLLFQDERRKESLHLAAQSKENKSLMDVYLNKLTELDTKYRNNVCEISNSVVMLEQILRDANNKNQNYVKSLDSYKKNLTKLTDQKERDQENVASSMASLMVLEKELSFATEAKRALKSYASCSFDDALSFASEHSTRIIRNIPNMANATIRLESIKEQKNGKTKEEVNAVIDMDGEENIPIDSLSGGERSSVDLAIDLAIIDLIEQKSAKGINLFILDEPFNGLDTVGIEMAIEVLKNSNINKKIVIVDHNPVINEMLNNKITVIRDGLTSSIVQKDSKSA